MSITRRDALRRLGGGALALLFGGAISDAPIEVKMRTAADRSAVWYEPVGLAIAPGQTVRWVIQEANAHTTTAYHPSNGERPLRIPEAAEPWDSGTLYQPGASFEVTFTEEGVYDYFCKPHEAGGMAGRIVVGEPGGPGDRSFGYWKDGPESGDWTEVPEAVQSTLPSPARIVDEGRVQRADL